MSVALARPLALVVEDDLEMRRLLAMTLRAEGIDVEEAADGPSGVARTRAWVDPRRRIVVTDVRLPGGSGLDLLADLRSRDGATPVVVITAFGDDATHARALALGASAVLDKPFDLGALRRLVRELLPPIPLEMP